MLKSKKSYLRKRGFIDASDIKILEDKSKEEIGYLLFSDEPTIRTSAVAVLQRTEINKPDFTSLLLKLLSEEKCLYVRIEICEALEKCDRRAAKQMIHYLGKIGSNQHKTLPGRISKKKSYPLPRDIIARCLARMSTTVFEEFVNVLETDDINKISEILDAIGFMVFYNKELSNEENAEFIFDIIKKYKNNDIILWKSILCLSAFALPKSLSVLKEFLASSNTLLRSEAKRSLDIII